MKKTITVKTTITDKYCNQCECGEKVTLRLCIWFHEGEDKTEVIGGHGAIPQKYKQRKFYLGVCKCGNMFYYK